MDSSSAAKNQSMVRLAKYAGPVQKLNRQYRRCCVDKGPALEALLDCRLRQQKAEGKIQSEQWYRNPERWLALTGVANPYKTVFNELRIIHEHGKEILDLFTRYRRQVFFGVGTGDTEIAMLREACDRLPPATLSVYAIDVQEFYLQLFAQQLLNLGKWLRFKHGAKSEIWFKGHNALFQYVKRDQLRLKPDYPNGLGDMDIALGNVIGNFEKQSEIFSQFNRLHAGAVVLGVHLARNRRELEYVFSLYRDNEIFRDFVLEPYLSAGNPKRKVEWVLDVQNRSIRAFAGSTQLFYSRKYDLDELEAAMKAIGFEKVSFYTYEQSALCTFRRFDYSAVPE